MWRVELNATGNDPDGTIVSYAWYNDFSSGSVILGSGQSLVRNLPEGANNIRVVATDNMGATASDTVIITVTPPVTSSPPTANAGADRIVNDTDNVGGEVVTLDGRASTDPDDDIVSFRGSRHR